MPSSDENKETIEKKKEEKKEECIYPRRGCFHSDKNGTVVVCPLAPCPLNLFRFGTHTQVIKHHLENEDWDSAYYYFDNLSSQSSFNCDLDVLNKIKQSSRESNKALEMKDFPLGCRVFLIEDDLAKMVDVLLNYKKMPYDKISPKGQKIYNKMKISFRKRINGNLKVLKHITMDLREKERRRDRAQERIIEKIKIMGKYGVQYTAQVGREVDKSNVDDEKILFDDDPEFSRDTGIFGKEREQIKKEEMEEKKRIEKEKKR